MTSAYTQFKINIDGLHNLTIIHDAFEAKVSPLDISDILRAQIVLAVSALDCYIHDLCLEAMTYIFKNKNFSDNNSFKNFPISMETLRLMATTSSIADRDLYLSKEIKKHNSYKSFQDPGKISEALGYLGVKALWVKIGAELNLQSTDLQNELTLIVQRRNQIAHESDINPELGIGEKFFIDSTIVSKTIEFIKKVVVSIEKIIDNQNILKP